MTKYLHEEKFIVGARDPQAQKNYADNWDRIFGEKEEELPEPPSQDVLEALGYNDAIEYNEYSERLRSHTGETRAEEEQRVAQGPSVTLYIEPEGAKIGWRCPECGRTRAVAAIDRNVGEYICIPFRDPPGSEDRRTHDYRPQLA